MWGRNTVRLRGRLAREYGLQSSRVRNGCLVEHDNRSVRRMDAGSRKTHVCDTDDVILYAFALSRERQFWRTSNFMR
jgi:hypothetical protein